LVYPDSANDLKIWGFVDQGVNIFRYRSLESDGGYRPPGLFQVSALEGGHLIVRIGFEQIAEMKGNRLGTKPEKVLEGGTLPDSLTPTFSKLCRASRRYFSELDYDAELEEVDERIETLTMESLRRLLLRIQSYGHGGAVLITPSIRATQLNIKHKLSYPRLAQAIQKNGILTAHDEFLDFLIREVMDEGEDDLSMRLFLGSAITKDELEDARTELDGSLWFVSLLSRIDGLVLMDNALTVRGFGVEILVSQRPEKVWQAHGVDASIDSRRELAYERFGTRHRSMMRYVTKVPGSVGFVISQDGPVRAMTTIGPDLVVWDNIQLQLDYAAPPVGVAPVHDEADT
jgi:hypothetical protein